MPDRSSVKYDSTFANRIATLADFCGDGEIFIQSTGETLELIGRSKKFDSTLIRTSYKQPKELAGEFGFIADLTRLSRILSNYETGRLSCDGNQLTVSNGKNSTMAMTISSGEIEWPTIKETQKTEFSKKFLTCLRQIKYAADYQDRFQELVAKYISITAEKGRCSMLALNGCNLCYAVFKVACKEKIDLRVPAAVIDRFLRIKEDSASIMQEGTKGLVRMGDFEILFCTAVFEPMDVSRLFTPRKAMEITLERDKLLDFISKASIIRHERVGLGMDLTYDPSQNTVRLEYESSLGRISEQIPVLKQEGDRTDIELRYSLDLARDSFKAINDDSLCFRITGPLDPTIIQSMQDGITYAHIIMPMRKTAKSEKTKTMPAAA